MDESDSRTKMPLLPPPPYSSCEAVSASSQASYIIIGQQGINAPPFTAIQVPLGQTAPVIITLPPSSQSNATNYANFQISTIDEMANPRLCYAIFTCLFCFWPLGLAAIITSCMCRNANRDGKLTKAHELSKLTKMLAHLALTIGFILISGRILYAMYVLYAN